MNFKKTYKDMIDDLQPSDELTSSILLNAEAKKMSFSKTKMAVLIAVACLALGTTALAAGRVSSYRSSASHLSDEKSIDKSRDNAKKLGITLEIPEEFSTEYSFCYSNIGDVQGLDEDGNAVSDGKMFVATYSKEKCPDLYLNIDPAFEPLVMEEGYVPKDINGITVYFYEDTYKFVPPDYELTEEDKVNIEKPGYEISYGSDTVKVQMLSGFIFEHDSKCYNVLSFDSNLTDDEWQLMAEELIGQ